MNKGYGIAKIVCQLLDNLPSAPLQIKQDMKKNLQAVLNVGFVRMDLVSREEFEIQSAVLRRTRTLLEEMEKKVEQMEQSLKS